ncbi:MAG: hypothetical protein RSG59_02205 [Ruthenibacterium sp.]
MTPKETTYAQLALTPEELGAEGICGKRASLVAKALLCAVRKDVRLNTYPVLRELAKTLARLYR